MVQWRLHTNTLHIIQLKKFQSTPLYFVSTCTASLNTTTIKKNGSFANMVSFANHRPTGTRCVCLVDEKLQSLQTTKPNVRAARHRFLEIEDLGATLDQFDTVDFSDSDVRKLEEFSFLRRIKSLLLNRNRNKNVCFSFLVSDYSFLSSICFRAWTPNVDIVLEDFGGKHRLKTPQTWSRKKSPNTTI